MSDPAEIAAIKVYRYVCFGNQSVIPKAFGKLRIKFVLGRKYIPIQPVFAFHRIFFKSVDVKKVYKLPSYETLDAAPPFKGIQYSDCAG